MASIPKHPVDTRQRVREYEAFKVIAAFVHDLAGTYGNNMQLSLYNRLVETTTSEDTARISNIVGGFTEFCSKYEQAIVNKDFSSIPRGAKIKYDGKDNIAIDIQHFIYKSDAPTQSVIGDHLLAITAILNRSEAAIAGLERRAPSIEDLGIDTSTPEGEFIGNIVSKMESIKGIETTDPMQAIPAIMSTGIIQDMMSGLQHGQQNGMDPMKLFGVLQGILGKFMPGMPPMPGLPPTTSSVQEIKDATPPLEGEAPKSLPPSEDK